ncbi:hypothetical protein AGMMS50293_30880 [Spirochaetia bacterium]|nr:hypothetical protein AGMMS50293_30880 [Spirochaetia bacterium]
MAALQSGIILNEGETLIVELEAELWATSSNPIAQLIGTIRRIISAILGFKKKGFVVITDKRVIEVYNQIQCYVINTGKHVKYLLPSSIMEAGYSKKATCGFFCPAYYFYYQGHTQTTSILLKGADEARAQQIVDAFYKAIAK